MELFSIIQNSNIKAQAVADSAYANAYTCTISLVDERTVVFVRKPSVQMLLERIDNLENDLEITFRKLNSNDQALLKSLTY